jgi:hypothetical protein
MNKKNEIVLINIYIFIIYIINIMEQNVIEKELLNNQSKLYTMNNLLKQHQFSEEFLINTREYYDSWKCIRTQNNLSPYFCFRYLYDTPEYDSADDWTDYKEIEQYLLKRNHSITNIENAMIKAMNDRKIEDDNK